MITRRERLIGGMMGLLVGDCLGVPYETVKPEDMPDLSKVSDLSVLPPGFVRKHPGVAPFTYSDDGGQALCLLASLLFGFMQEDFGSRLLCWLDEGYLAAKGGVFGTGGTTRTALGRIRAGARAAEAGLTEESALGNAGIMRALPVALVLRGSDRKTVDTAVEQCCVTHAHPRAQAVVAAYTMWAKWLLEGYRDHGAQRTELRRSVRDALHFVEEVSSVEVALEAYELGRTMDSFAPTGGFHVVDTFFSAVAANEAGDTYEDVVRAAIQYGNDTDTTAAVAGGVAGVRFGIDAIPKAWVDACLANAHPDVPELLYRLGREA